MAMLVGLRGVLDGALDERAHVRVGQGIEDVLARSPTRHDALGAQQTELLGDGREADPRRFGELRDAPLAVAQAIEQLQAREVARGAEDRGRAFELIVVHQRVPESLGVLLGSTMVVVRDRGCASGA